jgi:thioester reductase-like protein/aryl carrier-like protein
VHSPEVAPLIKALQGAAGSVHCLQCPTLEELLNAQPAAEAVPYTLDFNQVKREPIVILHSSGSTGLPKPITMTHGSFAILDNDRNFPTVPGRRNHDLTTWDFSQPGSCLYVPFPLFHLAGFFNNIMIPLYTQTIPVFGPATRLPSGALTAHIIQNLNVKGCFLPPSLVADLYAEPNGLDLLKSLEVLCYAGGPLSEAIGNELVQHVTLCQFYGSTELGLVRQLMPPKENWQYMEFHPLSRLELQPADDGAYELVVFADAETESHSGLNHNLPGVSEFRTKDLFRRHPTEPNLWKFHARRDDILVLSNGEKFNPIPLELGVEAIPGVAGAVVAGQGQPRTALMVELRPDHGLGSEVVDSLWPAIARLNADTAGPGRVSKSMILIASADKPFIRAGKGTVVRKLTISAYEAELDALFQGSVEKPKTRRVLKPTAFRLADVQEVVLSIIQDTLYGEEIHDTDDLYSQGLDSAKTLETVSQLKASLDHGQGLSWLKPEIVYAYPSVAQLSSLLLTWLNEGTYPNQVDRVARMTEVLARYENALPRASSSSSASASASPHSQDGPSTVVLVGSTGYLGQYLLSALAQDAAIKRIICLNRSPVARARWQAHLSANEGMADIPAAWQDKVSFLQADFAAPSFGLDATIYHEILADADTIVHSAWQVNFVAPLDAFAASFSGLVNSIALATHSTRAAHLIYISSIAAAGVWSRPSAAAAAAEAKLVPEALIANPADALRNGYGESKHIAEHLVSAAGSKAGVSASILRIGQIAPSTSGQHRIVWPAGDAVAVLLRACKRLQAIPTDVLEADWLPVNAVVDVAQRVLHLHRDGDRCETTTKEVKVYNLVNPVPTAWAALVPAIQAWSTSPGPSSTASKGAALVSFAEWIEAAKASPAADAVLPLIGFFELQIERGRAHRYAQDNFKQVAGSDIKAVDGAQLGAWLAALH